MYIITIFYIKVDHAKGYLVLPRFGRIMKIILETFSTHCIDGSATSVIVLTSSLLKIKVNIVLLSTQIRTQILFKYVHKGAFKKHSYMLEDSLPDFGVCLGSILMLQPAHVYLEDNIVHTKMFLCRLHFFSITETYSLEQGLGGHLFH